MPGGGPHADQAARHGQRPGHGGVTVLLQAKREAAALAGLAPDLDLAAEEPRVLLRDREAQAGAGTAARRVGLVEPLEQVRQVLGRDSGALVGDLDEGAGPVASDSNRDAVAAVLERVADEV